MVPLDAGATIRPAVQQDASRLAEILVFSKRMAYRDIFQDDYGSFVFLQVLPLAQQFLCRQNLAGFFVYEEAGILKGLARWKEPKSGVAELLLLYVDPFFQRSGSAAGGGCLGKALGAGKKSGCPPLLRKGGIFPHRGRQKGRRVFGFSAGIPKSALKRAGIRIPALFLLFAPGHGAFSAEKSV